MNFFYDEMTIGEIAAANNTGSGCADYFEDDYTCSRGISVTPLFGKFFCEKNHDRCPLVQWERSLTEKKAVIRPKSFSRIWRG